MKGQLLVPHGGQYHKKYVRISALSKIDGDGGFVFPESQRMTCSGFPLGYGSTNNMYSTVHQIFSAFAISGHPLVDGRISDGTFFDEKSIKRFIDQKVLEGLKVLDLGCGTWPVFARAVRVFGGTAYTVDLKESSEFYYGPEHEYRSGYGQIERAHHLAQDLTSESIVEKILELSRGNFDLVSWCFVIPNSSRVREPTLETLKDVSLQVLKEGGLVFKAQGLEFYRA